jgi:hypothetical protein
MALFRTWQRILQQARNRQPAPQARPRRRALPLRLETLEDRTVPSTFFVSSATGADGNDGSAAAPFGSIQHAINAAQSGDTILLAGGGYGFNAAEDRFSSGFGTTAVAFVLNKQLTILGGYSTNNWTTASPTANPTYIDGTGQYRCVMVTSLGGGNTASLDLEGVTVKNGLAVGIPARGGNDAIFGFGGGLFVDFGDSSAVQTGPIVLRNDTFLNDRAVGTNTGSGFGGAGAGGGAEFRDAQNVTLDHVTFQNDQAIGGTGPVRGGDAIGGAFHSDASNITGSFDRYIGNSAIAPNSAGNGIDDGTADADGGAVAVQFGTVANLTNETATGNYCTAGNATGGQAGGAFGAAFFTQGAAGDGTTLNITASVIQNNAVTAGSGVTGGVAGGAALESADATVNLSRDEIISNTVTGSSPGGGGVYLTSFLQQSAVSITNCIIADNVVRLGGTGAQGGGGGGGIYLQGVKATLVHDTVDANQLGSGLVFGLALVALADSTPAGTVANVSFCIFADHNGVRGTDTINVRPNSTVNLNTNLMANNANLNTPSGGSLTGQSTNITAASAGFISPSAPTFNFGLTSNSPAVAKATDGNVIKVDYYGNTRRNPTALGALELGSKPPPAPPPSNLVAIANGFTHSKEHYIQLITADYLTYVKRSPTQAEINNYWLPNLLGGAMFTDEQVEAQFIGSPEYINDHGGAGAGWVNGMYQDLLHRTPSQTEVNYWLTQLGNGVTTYTVALGFAASLERETTRVQSDYRTYLGRSASGTEVSYWVNQFANNSQTNEDLVAGFVGSTEYFTVANKGNDDRTTWLRSVYSDVLGRTPSASEIQYWLGQMA